MSTYDSFSKNSQGGEGEMRAGCPSGGGKMYPSFFNLNYIWQKFIQYSCLTSLSSPSGVVGHANTYAPIIKGANSWRNVTSAIFVFINMINKTACQFCLSLGDFPQVPEHMVLLFFVRHCSFVLFWSWIAFCLLFPLFYVIRSPILTEGTEFRCGGAYNANDYFFQFKALHSRKIDAKILQYLEIHAEGDWPKTAG